MKHQAIRPASGGTLLAALDRGLATGNSQTKVLQSDRACATLGLIVRQYGYPTRAKNLHSHFTNDIFKPDLSSLSGQRPSVTSLRFFRPPRHPRRRRRLFSPSYTLPLRIGIISEERHFEMSSTHVFRVQVCSTQSLPPSPSFARTKKIN